jgi:hypothetical protein
VLSRVLRLVQRSCRRELDVEVAYCGGCRHRGGYCEILEQWAATKSWSCRSEIETMLFFGLVVLASYSASFDLDHFSKFL